MRKRAGVSEGFVIRMIVLGAVLCLVALGMVLLFRTDRRFLEQKTWLTYTLPPKTVVYDEDPAEVTRLLTLPGYRVCGPVGAGHFPDRWERQLQELHIQPCDVLLFSHMRTDLQKLDRWVIVTGYFDHRSGPSERTLHLSAVAVTPASPGYNAWVGKHNVYPLTMTTPEPCLRLYAGQPDPADPGLFTIAYEVAGEKGTIRGEVWENDQVLLRVLDGPLRSRAWVNRVLSGK